MARTDFERASQVAVIEQIAVMYEESLRSVNNVHNTNEVLFRLCANTDPLPVAENSGSSHPRAG